MKKFSFAAICLLIAIMLSLFSACSIDGNNGKTDKYTARSYDVTWDDAECGKIEGFDYTFDGGPTAEDFVNNKELHLRNFEYFGFTMLQLKCSDGEYFRNNVEPVLAENNLKTSVSDHRILKLVRDRPEADVIYSKIESIVDEYKNCPSITTWDISESATRYDFDVLGVIVDAFRRFDPDRKVNINLLPNYMFSSIYGNSGGMEAYESYVADFMRIVRPSYISVYHFDVAFSLNDENGRNINEYHIIRYPEENITRVNNYEIIRKYADMYDTDIRIVTEFTRMNDVNTFSDYCMHYIMNLAVAYGAKQICVFAYDDADAAGFTSAVGENCSLYAKSESLYGIKDSLLGTLEVLQDKHADKVFHFTPDEYNSYTTRYVPYGPLFSATVTPDQAEHNRQMITFYDDGSFLITDTRMWYPATKASQRYSKLSISGVTLEWYDCDTAEWKNISECKKIAVSGDTYTVKTVPGENLLLRAVSQ